MTASGKALELKHITNFPFSPVFRPKQKRREVCNQTSEVCDRRVVASTRIHLLSANFLPPITSYIHCLCLLEKNVTINLLLSEGVQSNQTHYHKPVSSRLGGLRRQLRQNTNQT